MSMVKRTHIYDMDGTIVCSLHRYRTMEKSGKITIDLNHWLENEHRAMQDSLLPLATQYQKDLTDRSTFVIIATARVINLPDSRFIREVLGQPNALISRDGRDDQRGGAELKITGLRKVINQHKLHLTRKVFFEDNPKYLAEVCAAIGAEGRWILSKQGW
jgi:hypothetical protein